MSAPVNPFIAATERPPIMEVRRWLAETPPPEGLPLLDLSQAAPAGPPPEPLRAAIARAALEDAGAHLYGPVLGLPALRERIAARWSADYGGRVEPAQVAITAGCNQAFTAAIATLAGPGDEVILPSPWYFNHKMALDMAGIGTVPLPVGPDMLPDPRDAAARITAATRAIVLVSPNNPAGVEYPADLIAAFLELARARGLALILDETYRDFHATEGAPHGLFTDPDWHDTLIQLYSFSKAYRLTGHRVGALVASRARLVEVEKYLDTVQICAGQLGQRAALWGMENLGDWLAGERREILARRAAMAAAVGGLAGWRLAGIGAYFAWIEHPWPGRAAPEVARSLLARAGVLMLPGTMFTAAGERRGATSLRAAFANVDTTGIATVARRLQNLSA